MMNFVQEEQQKECYVDKEDEDEKPFISFSSTSSSSANSPNNYNQNRSLFWASDSNKNQDFMELSLGGIISGGGGGGGEGSVEKEHMFDKVVTPSDVGKLNRLVIPKQHAERYFPLNSSSTQKGVLLNFEDRNGKAWRFGYSYWNSSQSYVMTKGWSRFVKEKQLNAGDVVSFQRGVGESSRNRLYIDWKRRPNPLESTPIQFQFQYPQEIRWGRHHPIAQPQLESISQPFENFPNSMNYNLYPCQFNLQRQLKHEPTVGYRNGVLKQCHLRQDGNLQPMVINSVPVVHGTITKTVTPLKRLRLFGVNMECSSSTTTEDKVLSSQLALPAASSSSPPPRLRLHGSNSPV